MSLAHRPDRKPPALFATVLQSCSLLFLRNMGHGHCGLALMAFGRANIFRSSLNRPLHARHIAASYRTAGAATACPVMADSLHIRSEEHTSELQSLMRISYAVFCLQKKKIKNNDNNRHTS